MPSPRAVLGWAIIVLAGACCFGMGIAVAIVFPLVVVLMVPPGLAPPARRLLLAVPVVTATLYVVVGYVYAVLMERELDQGFVLLTFLDHPRAILAMTAHLVAFGATRLILGFVALHAPYPGLLACAVVTVSATMLAIVLARGDADDRRVLLAVALLAVAIYGLIAVGRANTYLTFGWPPSAGAAAARYHYLGTVPLFVMGAVVLARVGAWQGIRTIPRLSLLAIWLLVQASRYRTSGWTIPDYSWQRDYVQHTLAAIDTLVDARAPGDPVFIRNQPAPPGLLGPAFGHSRFPGWAALFVIAHRDDVVRGRRVYFVEGDGAVLEQARTISDSRLAGLLIVP